MFKRIRASSRSDAQNGNDEQQPQVGAHSIGEQDTNRILSYLDIRDPLTTHDHVKRFAAKFDKYMFEIVSDMATLEKEFVYFSTHGSGLRKCIGFLFEKSDFTWSIEEVPRYPERFLYDVEIEQKYDSFDNLVEARTISQFVTGAANVNGPGLSNARWVGNLADHQMSHYLKCLYDMILRAREILQHFSSNFPTTSDLHARGQGRPVFGNTDQRSLERMMYARYSKLQWNSVASETKNRISNNFEPRFLKMLDSRIPVLEIVKDFQRKFYEDIINFIYDNVDPEQRIRFVQPTGDSALSTHFENDPQKAVLEMIRNALLAHPKPGEDVIKCVDYITYKIGPTPNDGAPIRFQHIHNSQELKSRRLIMT